MSNQSASLEKLSVKLDKLSGVFFNSCDHFTVSVQLQSLSVFSGVTLTDSLCYDALVNKEL